LNAEEKDEDVFLHIEKEERNPIVNVRYFLDLIIVCQKLFLHFNMLGFEACDIVNIVIPFLMVYSSYRSRQ
jgi:hypothetical protein